MGKVMRNIANLMAPVVDVVFRLQDSEGLVDFKKLTALLVECGNHPSV